MTDDEPAGGPDEGWAVGLQQLEKLDSDVGEDGEAVYVVEFELLGRGVNGTISATIVDPADEATIVAEALVALHDGLDRWAKVVLRRRGAEGIKSVGDQPGGS